MFGSLVPLKDWETWIYNFSSQTNKMIGDITYDLLSKKMMVITATMKWNNISSSFIRIYDNSLFNM